ncbi:MAG: CGNR zinc finger domain-containing protein, partial [Chloroflexota bacterium]
PLVELSSPLPYRWLAGHGALDFANTVAWLRYAAGDHPIPLAPYEHLTSYDRLVDCSKHAGLVDPQVADSLLQEARRLPDDADRTLERARILREAIHQVLGAVAWDEPVSPAMLATLNDHYADAVSQRRIVATPDGFILGWSGSDVHLEAPIWHVSLAAAELLSSPQVGRVGQCFADLCGFLFLDTSRGGRRRWCDMNHCGNVAKVRRHRDQARETPA